jgi:hypothetical protein
VTEAERDYFSASFPAFPAPPKFSPPPAPPLKPALSAAAFASDSPLAPSAYAPPPTLALRLARFADLAVAAPMPFALALLAPAGGGKSSALGWIEARVAKTGALVARLDAADLAAEPERALAVGLYRALAPAQGALVAEAARAAELFGADAGAFSRAAQERLDGLRRRLIAERQALAEQQARRAALPDTVLYDWPGSQVDAHARRMRGGFETRMRGFGLTGDALLTFKDRTRDLAAHAGFPARLRACLHALYAYRGQTALLVYAVLFLLLAQGLDWLAQHKADWLGWLARTHEAGAQTADFLRDRIGFLDSGPAVATLLALVCLGLNLWRAYAFCAPLLGAAQRLDADVAARAREHDHAVADQQRVVERLAAQTSAAAQQAREAEQRAESAGASKEPPAFLERDSLECRRDHALGFLNALSAGLSNGNARLVAMVDGFEKAGAGAALFERIGALLARPGFVALFALDPALCGAQAQERALQLTLRLDSGVVDPPSFAPLGAPLSAPEERLLSALAPLAGTTPRATKRLRNFYAFLRPALGADDKLAPALVLALAAEIAGGAERDALASLVTGGHADAARAQRLAEFLKVAQDVGGSIEAESLRRAWTLARALVG